MDSSSNTEKNNEEVLDSSGTKMVPRMFHITKKDDGEGYKAEKLMFDLLEEFGMQHNEPMFVVHGYKYNSPGKSSNKGPNTKQGQIKGEHDFVLIHHQLGLIFFQVKAGNKHHKYNEALEQLKRDEKSVTMYLDKFQVENLSEGAGEMKFMHSFVVMPNCPKKDSPGVGLFYEDCQSVAAFTSWWVDNVKNTIVTGFTQPIYEHLVKRWVMYHL